jgi:hypothetical protein
MADSLEHPCCELCGKPMPAGEEMFKYHGYSGPCPVAPPPVPVLVPQDWSAHIDAVRVALGNDEPTWWRRCRTIGHAVSIDDLAHRGGKYLHAVEYFCSQCSRGESRGVVEVVTTGHANDQPDPAQALITQWREAASKGQSVAEIAINLAHADQLARICSHKVPNEFKLNGESALELYNFFMRCGYISYEHDMPIHKLFSNLKAFLGK